MPNRPRPRCPECDRAMEPLFLQRPRGNTFQRLPEAFACREHDTLAQGRAKPRFLTNASA